MSYLLQINKIANEGASWALRVKDLVFLYVPRIAGAILFYMVGTWFIGWLVRLLSKIFIRKKLDLSLQTFLLSAIKTTLLILLLISIAGMLGVDTTAFGALLVGAGVAIGSALNGTLGNFSGGVMMLIFKPFKVGDIIESQGQTGEVKEMGIFNTVLLSSDNKTVILPNGPVSTGVIINHNTAGFLRVDLIMAIAPDMSVSKAREVAIAAMKKQKGVLETPEPEVSVLRVADGMVTLAIRPYTTQGNYWPVYFGVQELVKEAFDANGIQAPALHQPSAPTRHGGVR